MGRKIAWVLSLALLLFTGVVGIYNGITQWSDGESTLQRSVTAGAFLYGVLGLITTRNAQVPGGALLPDDAASGRGRDPERNLPHVAFCHGQGAHRPVPDLRRRYLSIAQNCYALHRLPTGGPVRPRDLQTRAPRHAIRLERRGRRRVRPGLTRNIYRDEAALHISRFAGRTAIE